MMAALLALLLPLNVAQARDLRDLLESPNRPTMSEVAQVLPQIRFKQSVPVGAQDAPYFDKRLDIPAWLPRLLENGPRMIAAFERTYPGATWVFMGRDGMPWADVFEAFYSSIGQPGRVARLGISKPSMKGVDRKSLLGLMASQGISVDGLAKSHPVIFVDSVSNGFGRQGRRLMAAIYAEWMDQGRDPLLLINKVDMIGSIVSTFKGAPNDVQFKPFHQYLQALLFLGGRAPMQEEQLQHQLRVMTFAEQDGLSNEAGYTHFLGAWHESFQSITYDSRSGEYKATPGEVFPLEMRQSVLWTQKEIWKFVDAGECERRVLEEASRLGYDFPLARPAPRSADPFGIRHFREKIGRRKGLPTALEGGNWRHPPVYAGHFSAARETGLLETIRTQGARAGDRETLLSLFNQERGALGGIDWSQSATPRTTLADIKYLRSALRSDCSGALKGEP